MHPCHQHTSVDEIKGLLAPFKRPHLLEIAFNEETIRGNVLQVGNATLRRWQDIDADDGAGGVGEGEGAGPDAGAAAYVEDAERVIIPRREGKRERGFVEGMETGDEDGVLTICKGGEKMWEEGGGGVCLSALSLLAPWGQGQWWLCRFSFF